MGIDDRGVIAGYYSDGNHVTRGFHRAVDGTFRTFDPPGSAYTRPQAIAAGMITGYFTDSSNVAHGFVRSR
jgi:hypothetical protein